MPNVTAIISAVELMRKEKELLARVEPNMGVDWNSHAMSDEDAIAVWTYFDEKRNKPENGIVLDQAQLDEVIKKVLPLLEIVWNQKLKTPEFRILARREYLETCYDEQMAVRMLRGYPNDETGRLEITDGLTLPHRQQILLPSKALIPARESDISSIAWNTGHLEYTICRELCQAMAYQAREEWGDQFLRGVQPPMESERTAAILEAIAIYSAKVIAQSEDFSEWFVPIGFASSVFRYSHARAIDFQRGVDALAATMPLRRIALMDDIIIQNQSRLLLGVNMGTHNYAERKQAIGEHTSEDYSLLTKRTAVFADLYRFWFESRENGLAEEIDGRKAQWEQGRVNCIANMGEFGHISVAVGRRTHQITLYQRVLERLKHKDHKGSLLLGKQADLLIQGSQALAVRVDYN